MGLFAQQTRPVSSRKLVKLEKKAKKNLLAAARSTILTIESELGREWERERKKSEIHFHCWFALHGKAFSWRSICWHSNRLHVSPRQASRLNDVINSSICEGLCIK